MRETHFPPALDDKITDIARMMREASLAGERLYNARHAGSVSAAKAELEALADITNRVMVYASIAQRAAAKHLSRNPLAGVKS